MTSLRQTEEHRWAQFNYQADPALRAIVDTLVAMAAPGRGRHRELRCVVARDFFLFGTAMVVRHLGLRHAVRPWDWRINPKGEAEFMGDVPRTYAGASPPVLPPEDFILLAVEEPLPPPSHEAVEVLGAEPWLAAWTKASKDLESFLARAA